jgi:phosphatidylglycerophosphate synthase
MAWGPTPTPGTVGTLSNARGALHPLASLAHSRWLVPPALPSRVTFTCSLRSRSGRVSSDIFYSRRPPLVILVFWPARYNPDRVTPNHVTAVRALLVAVLAALILVAPARPIAWTAVIAATIAAVLDGVDGWLARRTKMSSAFGARFDTEVDALLILVLAILAWRWNKAGWWVVISGLLRYVFVAAGWLWALWASTRGPLTPTRRGRVICVVQIVALIVAVAPIIPPPLSASAAAAGLLALAYSFLIDTIRLWRNPDSA